MYFMFVDNSDSNADAKISVLNLTDYELKHISKYVVVKYFEKYIEDLWERLEPELRLDPEIAACLPCYNHYNVGRSHLDCPAALKKYCWTCRRLKEELTTKK